MKSILYRPHKLLFVVQSRNWGCGGFVHIWHFVVNLYNRLAPRASNTLYAISSIRATIMNWCRIPIHLPIRTLHDKHVIKTKVWHKHHASNIEKLAKCFKLCNKIWDWLYPCSIIHDITLVSATNSKQWITEPPVARQWNIDQCSFSWCCYQHTPLGRRTSMWVSSHNSWLPFMIV